MAKWKVGDQVQMKGGGRRMVIDNDFLNGNVICVWEVGSETKERMYHEDTLQAYDERQDPNMPAMATSGGGD